MSVAKLHWLLDSINHVHTIEKLDIQIFGVGHFNIWFKSKRSCVVMLGLSAQSVTSGKVKITPKDVGSVHISDMPISSMARILMICDDTKSILVSKQDVERMVDPSFGFDFELVFNAK